MRRALVLTFALTSVVSNVFAASPQAQSAKTAAAPGATLTVSGRVGMIPLLQMNGHSYIDVEAFARLTESALVYRLGGAVLTLSAAKAVSAPDPKLDTVLRQMDAASTKFQSAQADVRKVKFEKVVRDTTEESGTVYFLRTKTGTEMGAVFGQKYIHFADGKGAMYDNVGHKTTPFNATQSDRARVESFLTLGFGGSGKDLERAWNIEMQGNETIDGTPTAKLNLVPKDASVANSFTHILVWVDPTRSLSLKQEYFTPEGDTQTSYYTHIRYNTPVDAKKFAAPKH